ncbi:OprO/OprP family phosphate-selective porin [Sphingomonas sp. S1-29]|nr:porin [Sphingomonas sp. S1-29]UZK68810.1 OprO/OprP family phosphate-selective porin [Sphingomonas sp. S1-29]
MWLASAALVLIHPAAASAQTVQELQRQIDELKAQLQALTQAKAAIPPLAAPATMPSAADVSTPNVPQVASLPPATMPVASLPLNEAAWYDRLRFRGYTQMRYNAVVAGDETAPDGVSRLRSVHDASINENGGFLLRRVRLVLQGDVTDHIQLYLQHDFGTAVNNQSSTERRENFGQLRDAYVDIFSPDREFRLRVGQSKVPVGWENLQSSSDRLTLDRSDAINSAVPGEREIGIVAYYTPSQVQAIWDRLEARGQKLFGNYGAFGVGIYNGQGINRTEQNAGRMKVAMATWPFALDALGLRGQVLELGGSVLLNEVSPEVRGGGTTTDSYSDNRIGLHGILYPQPFGVQAEWTWGRGPQFDAALEAITEQRLSGGYVQVMADLGETGGGRLVPYGRWQRYRGGWKANVNAPQLETDELEIGFEWQFMEALELTVAYANMHRREADERRMGRAEGDLVRTQLQWSY